MKYGGGRVMFFFSVSWTESFSRQLENKDEFHGNKACIQINNRIPEEVQTFGMSQPEPRTESNRKSEGRHEEGQANALRI